MMVIVAEGPRAEESGNLWQNTPHPEGELQQHLRSIIKVKGELPIVHKNPYYPLLGKHTSNRAKKQQDVFTLNENMTP